MKESEFIPFERAVRIVTKRPTFMKGVKGFLGALRAGIERQPPSDRTKEEIYAELLASFRHSGVPIYLLEHLRHEYWDRPKKRKRRL